MPANDKPQGSGKLMTQERASKIQSNTDKKGGGGDGFKERAQSAASKNEAAASNNAPKK
ncbi:hypothetical protein RB594_007839 [Gaeumannomyces avenae]